MRILLSNDDGIHAPGLAALEHIAAQLSDDVWVVAPETEQSGASRSLTLHEPLRMRKISDRKFAIQGTPTDCVMMAVKHILPEDEPPQLVLSGVNRGANLAEDVTYSGTVAAAMEGTMLGIPSIALSQVYNWEGRHKINWSCAKDHGPRIVRDLLAAGWPKDVLINVNFPDCAASAVAGVKVTEQGQRDQSTTVIDARVDTRGVNYFWLGLARSTGSLIDGTDLHAIYHNSIAITPLHLNLTHHTTRKDLSDAFQAYPNA